MAESYAAAMAYTTNDAFAGQVALVTGAGGGMGRAISMAFAATGANVVAADVSEADGAQTVQLINNAGGTAEFVRTDVSKASEVDAMVDHCIKRFGQLDCAVNAAAIELESDELINCEEDVFDRLFAVNVKSIFLSMKYEIAAMLAAGNGGAIVNIGSTNSFRPQPNQTVYTGTKHAVIGMTKAAAIDYAGRGIRVNAICPGAIDTPMLRNAMARRNRDERDVIARLSLIGRFGLPEEIARAALWLCSDESSFTIGHALSVDGGYLAR
jgi:NAD(P)-dependent dehydrogenase (short-subunit alcohol dehydrogenase family)